MGSNSIILVGSAGHARACINSSIVRQCVKIGEWCLIGMGQRGLADCEAGTLCH